MKPKPTPQKPVELSPDEWDFRGISERELLTALLYEYTRSSNSLTTAIQKWHLLPFDKASLHDFKYDVTTAKISSVLRRKKKLTNATAIGIAFDCLDKHESAEHVLYHFLLQLEITLPDQLAARGVKQIATRFEAFLVC